MNFLSLVPSTILISTSIPKHAVKIDVIFYTQFDGTDKHFNCFKHVLLN